MYIWSPPGLLSGCEKRLRVPDIAIVEWLLGHQRHNWWSHLEERRRRTRRRVFFFFFCRALHSFHQLHVWKASKLLFFFTPPPPIFSPLHHVIMNMERSVRMFVRRELLTSKKDGDCLPVVHRIMIVFVCTVRKTCQGQDRWRAVLPLAVLDAARRSHQYGKHNYHHPRLSQTPLLINSRLLESLQPGLIKDFWRHLDKFCPQGFFLVDWHWAALWSRTHLQTLCGHSRCTEYSLNRNLSQVSFCTSSRCCWLRASVTSSD